jgi:hypothetical protein
MARYSLPKAEAKVVIRDLSTTDWRDSLDFDPVSIPIESRDTTDVFDSTVMNVVEAINEAEMVPGHNIPSTTLEYMLVWSSNGHPVKGVCPRCDDPFTVSEGFPHELPDSQDAISPTMAVICGCVDD